MRGEPHSGFGIVRIRKRTSDGTLGRPRCVRLFQRHRRRKPCRCQATTVSGLTMTMEARHPLPDPRQPDPQHAVCSPSVEGDEDERVVGPGAGAAERGFQAAGPRACGSTRVRSGEWTVR